MARSKYYVEAKRRNLSCGVLRSKSSADTQINLSPNEKAEEAAKEDVAAETKKEEEKRSSSKSAYATIVTKITACDYCAGTALILLRLRCKKR